MDAKLLQMIDGTHPRYGRAVELGLHFIILLSAIAIAVETIQGIPPVLDRLLYGFEIFVLLVFVTEYLIRVICSNRPFRYIFSFWGVIDLLSCLPAIVLLQPQWQVIRTVRLIRLVRLLKLFRSSDALDRLARALVVVRGELLVFGVLSCLMLYVSAAGIYLFEHDVQPEEFSSIPKSLWWAVASFTTVGYGDMYPITTGGRIFTSLMLFIGLGIVAVPSAIITAALLETQGTTSRRRTSGETNNQERET